MQPKGSCATLSFLVNICRYFKDSDHVYLSKIFL